MPEPGLELIRPLTWLEVFEIWRANEENLDHWKAHWTEKGFTSWEAWRQKYVEPLGLAKRKWALYRVTDPLAAVPAFRGGPFRGWTEKYYEGERAPSLAKLVQHPEVRMHSGVVRLMETFPSPTTVSAVRTDDGIVVVEGMHRLSAIALTAESGQSIAKQLYIALAEYEPGTLPVVGGFKNDGG